MYRQQINKSKAWAAAAALALMAAPAGLQAQTNIVNPFQAGGSRFLTPFGGNAIGFANLPMQNPLLVTPLSRANAPQRFFLPSNGGTQLGISGSTVFPINTDLFFQTNPTISPFMVNAPVNGSVALPPLARTSAAANAPLTVPPNFRTLNTLPNVTPFNVLNGNGFRTDNTTFGVTPFNVVNGNGFRTLNTAQGVIPFNVLNGNGFRTGNTTLGVTPFNVLNGNGFRTFNTLLGTRPFNVLNGQNATVFGGRAR